MSGHNFKDIYQNIKQDAIAKKRLEGLRERIEIVERQRLHHHAVGLHCLAAVDDLRLDVMYEHKQKLEQHIFQLTAQREQWREPRASVN